MPKFVRRPEARPDEILDAALRRFVDSGFAGTRMEEIAGDAGVTPGTIYRYFPGKEALVGALLVRGIDAEWSRGRIVSEAYATMTARQIVELLLHRWADHLEAPEPEALLLLVVREAAQFPDAAKKYVTQLLTPGCLALGRALRHGIEQGEFPLLEVEATSQALAGTVVQGVLWRATFARHLAPLPSTADPVRLTIESLVRGLPRPGESRPARPVPPPAPPGKTTVTGRGEASLRIVTLLPPGSR